MARTGESIRNPVTGETVTFLETTADSGGARLRLELVVEGGAAGPPRHLHPRLTERYEVQDGRLHVRLGGAEHVLEADDRFEFPRGEPHTFWNVDDAPARVVVELEPAGGFERFLETTYAFARDGKTDRKGMPDLLRAAVVGRAHLDDFALARPPLRLQRVLFAVLAPVARLLDR